MSDEPKEVKITLYRLIGYDKENVAYDITRIVNLDTEQFINLDLNQSKIMESDKTTTINIQRQRKRDKESNK